MTECGSVGDSDHLRILIWPVGIYSDGILTVEKWAAWRCSSLLLSYILDNLCSRRKQAEWYHACHAELGWQEVLNDQVDFHRAEKELPSQDTKRKENTQLQEKEPSGCWKLFTPSWGRPVATQFGDENWFAGFLIAQTCEVFNVFSLRWWMCVK